MWTWITLLLNPPYCSRQPRDVLAKTSENACVSDLAMKLGSAPRLLSCRLIYPFESNACEEKLSHPKRENASSVPTSIPLVRLVRLTWYLLHYETPSFARILTRSSFCLYNDVVCISTQSKNVPKENRRGIVTYRNNGSEKKLSYSKRKHASSVKALIQKKGTKSVPLEYHCYK